MAVHKIRLAGPWQCLQPSESPATWTTVTLPFHFATSDRCTTLKRRFHSPTGIDSTTSIMVAVSLNTVSAFVRLNGQLLEKVSVAELAADATGDITAFDVTGRLQPFNELEVELQNSQPAVDATLRAVELRIRSAEDDR